MWLGVLEESHSEACKGICRVRRGNSSRMFSRPSENMGGTNLKLQENLLEHSCLEVVCVVISEKFQKKEYPISITERCSEIKFTGYFYRPCPWQCTLERLKMTIKIG